MARKTAVVAVENSIYRREKEIDRLQGETRGLIRAKKTLMKEIEIALSEIVRAEEEVKEMKRWVNNERGKGN